MMVASVNINMSICYTSNKGYDGLKESKMTGNLTKSKFKLALECPTKLYYIDKTQYANQKMEDSFLKALAEGGYQLVKPTFI